MGNQAGKGRPKGRRNQGKGSVQRLLDDYAEAVTRKCLAEALQGDRSAMRLCMERLSPARRDAWKGIAAGLISGRVSPATAERAKQCKFRYVYQGHIEKIPILDEIMPDAAISKDQVPAHLESSDSPRP